MKVSFALTLLLALGDHALASVNKWTPADFDWSRIKSYEGILKQNVSATPPSDELVAYAADKYGLTKTDLVDPNVAILGITLGLGWNIRTGVSLAVEAIGLGNTIGTCTNAGQGSIGTDVSCAFGIAASLGGIGRE